MTLPGGELALELERLRAENARLIALLEAKGIDWRAPKPTPATVAVTKPESSSLTTEQKVALFRRLFRGRTDVYPLRWESAKGKSGYSPACGNEWKTGVCDKPRIKCGDCPQRQLLPMTDQVIYDHLAGKHTVGVYPLLTDESCYFLAADFDETDWREDASAFRQSCYELNIPAALEISRSGKGAHVWIFFADPVPAREATRRGPDQSCLRTHSPAFPVQLRPLLSQSGQSAQGRFRQPDRAPIAEEAPRAGVQRVR